MKKFKESDLEVEEYDKKESISVVINDSKSDIGSSMYETPDPFTGR